MPPVPPPVVASSAETTIAPQAIAIQVGVVSHFFPNVSVAAIKVERTLSVGETIHFKGETTDFQMKITSLEINKAKISKALKGVEVGILVPEKVHEGDLVFRIG